MMTGKGARKGGQNFTLSEQLCIACKVEQQQADHSFSSPLPARVSYVIASGNVRPCAVCDAFFQELADGTERDGPRHTGPECYERWCGTPPHHEWWCGWMAAERYRSKKRAGTDLRILLEDKRRKQNPPITRKEKSGEEVSLCNKWRTSSSRASSGGRS